MKSKSVYLPKEIFEAIDSVIVENYPTFRNVSHYIEVALYNYYKRLESDIKYRHIIGARWDKWTNKNMSFDERIFVKTEGWEKFGIDNFSAFVLESIVYDFIERNIDFNFNQKTI